MTDITASQPGLGVSGTKRPATDPEDEAERAVPESRPDPFRTNFSGRLLSEPLGPADLPRPPFTMTAHSIIAANCRGKLLKRIARDLVIRLERLPEIEHGAKIIDRVVFGLLH